MMEKGNLLVAYVTCSYTAVCGGVCVHVCETPHGAQILDICHYASVYFHVSGWQKFKYPKLEHHSWERHKMRWCSYPRISSLNL